MSTRISRNLNVLLILILLIVISSSSILFSQNSSDEWKVGVARQNITPQYPTWMAGYAMRTSPSEGKLHDIWAKAITFGDAKGMIKTVPFRFSFEFKL